MEILRKIEKDTINWIISKRFKIYIFLLLALIFWYMPSMPYLNIVISSGMSVFFIVLTFLLLFNLSIRIVYIFVVLLFLTCLVYQLLNQVEKADILGNYIFAVLMYQVINYLLGSYGNKEE